MYCFLTYSRKAFCCLCVTGIPTYQQNKNGLCVSGKGSAEADWFGCNSDNRPPLCFTPHNSLINAMHPKIAPLQHEIELNHWIQSVIDWKCQIRGAISLIIGRIFQKCGLSSKFPFMCLYGTSRYISSWWLAVLECHLWGISAKFPCFTLTDACVTTTPNRLSKCRCILHCCWLLYIKSEATDH